MKIGKGQGSVYKVEFIDMFSIRCGAYAKRWDGIVIRNLTGILKEIKRNRHFSVTTEVASV